MRASSNDSEQTLIAECMTNSFSAIVNSKSEKLLKNYITLLKQITKPIKYVTSNDLTTIDEQPNTNKNETSKKNLENHHTNNIIYILDPNEFYKTTIKEHLKLENICLSANLINLAYGLEVTFDDFFLVI
jgi:cupin superfamily acireductone dioxygenase involved in methionine salvage